MPEQPHETQILYRRRCVDPDCGRRFNTTDARKVFCSKKCGNRQRKRRFDEVQRKLRNFVRKPHVPTPCSYCDSVAHYRSDTSKRAACKQHKGMLEETMR